MAKTGKVTTKQVVETTVQLAPRVLAKLREELKEYPRYKAMEEEGKTGQALARNNVFDIALEDIDADSFNVDGFQIAMVTDAETSRLDQEKLKKLLMAKTGMSLKVIEDWFDRCTGRTPTKPHVRIVCPKK